nr:protein PET117 homolog, mitochondrial [Pelodiscus sinensis]|eukprot:XP_014426733.1 protein PET117 homolog, mitochondrial [Pelodiscus sinensis]
MTSLFWVGTEWLYLKEDSLQFHAIDYNEPCLLYFQRLHEGVVRDLERQSRKLENIRLLQEQITLTKQLEAERHKMLMEKESQQS